MKRSLMTALGLLVAAVTLLASSREKVRFEKLSYTEAMELASQQDKYLFIDIMATWCGPCKVMERNVFANPNVARYMNTHFVAIQIDVDDNRDGDLLRALDISAVPTLAFYNPQGQLAMKQEGGLGAEAFLQLAQSVRSWQPPKEPVTNLSTVDGKHRYLQMLSSQDPEAARSLALQYMENQLEDDPEMQYASAEDWEILSDFITREIDATDVSTAPMMTEVDRHLLRKIEPILEANYAAAYDYYDRTFAFMLLYMLEAENTEQMDFYNQANGIFQSINNEGSLPPAAFHDYNWLVYHLLSGNHEYFAEHCEQWLDDYFQDSADQHLRFVGWLLEDCEDAACVAQAKSLLAKAVAIGLVDDEEREMATMFADYLDSMD